VTAAASGVIVAYLVNQYPKVSHSFIRREILALERRGLKVLRFAVRGWDDPVVDPGDRSEREVTRLSDAARARRPRARRCCGRLSPIRGASRRALATALRLGRRADRSLPYHLVYLAQACRLLEWLKAEQATHLHAHFGNQPGRSARCWLACCGGPAYSFTVHGPEEFDKPEFLGLGEKVRHAAFVVAVSSYGRSQLFRWAGFESWSKVKVVHCGLDAAFHAGGLTPVPPVPRLVCVGRLCEQKGQMLLIEAAPLLKVPQRAVRARAGRRRRDACRDRSRRSAASVCEHRVRITGWISGDDVRSEILGARALCARQLRRRPSGCADGGDGARSAGADHLRRRHSGTRARSRAWMAGSGRRRRRAGRCSRACLTTAPDVLATMGRAARTRVLARHDIDVEAGKLANLFATASAVRV
jgi:glycosyltransferase involved in cell wall biosynthesis